MTELSYSSTFNSFSRGNKKSPFNERPRKYAKWNIPKIITYKQINEEEEKKLLKNIEKLNEISNLKLNWNGYGAKPISNSIVTATRNLIRGLELQPQVFPTADDTIQLVYDGINESYLEFEVSKGKMIDQFLIDRDGKESYSKVENKVEYINKIVEKFYE